MIFTPQQKNLITYLRGQIQWCRTRSLDWTREFEAYLDCLKHGHEFVACDGHAYVSRDDRGCDMTWAEWPEYMQSMDDSLVFAEVWAEGTITRLNYTLVGAVAENTAGWAALWTPNDLSGARGYGAWSYDKGKGDDAYPPTRPIAVISAVLNGIGGA